eukprot:TRINITY_DN3537_c0_g1_i2.p1 TRINITY_DN3537_c0_g1~~TRINITY_DN3537_c0_g1_i2.p1  ORF type:complete len:828 (-),score=174.22 TRINITY_DN3537_c0_g1_i2:5-2488(-)
MAFGGGSRSGKEDLPEFLRAPPPPPERPPPRRPSSSAASFASGSGRGGFSSPLSSLALDSPPHSASNLPRLQGFNGGAFDLEDCLRAAAAKRREQAHFSPQPESHRDEDEPDLAGFVDAEESPAQRRRESHRDENEPDMVRFVAAEESPAQMRRDREDTESRRESRQLSEPSSPAVLASSPALTVASPVPEPSAERRPSAREAARMAAFQRMYDGGWRGPGRQQQQQEPQESRRVLRITLIGATGLRDADWNGTSDPFATCQVAGLDEIAHETKVADETLEPVWNEEFEIADYDWDRRPALKFCVLDCDGSVVNALCEADHLGNVELAVDESGFEGELKLEDSQNDTAALQLRVVVLPSQAPLKTNVKKEDTVTLEKVGERPKPQQRGGRSSNNSREKKVLRITLISAAGLRNAAWKGQSDTFATCQLASSDVIAYQTQMVKLADEALDPVWNEEFEIADYDWDHRPALKFHVFDSVSGTLHDLRSADNLGHAELADFDETGFDGELRLQGSQNPLARLKLRVVVLSASTRDLPATKLVPETCYSLERGGLHENDTGETKAWFVRSPGPGSPKHEAQLFAYEPMAQGILTQSLRRETYEERQAARQVLAKVRRPLVQRQETEVLPVPELSGTFNYDVLAREERTCGRAAARLIAVLHGQLGRRETLRAQKKAEILELEEELRNTESAEQCDPICGLLDAILPGLIGALCRVVGALSPAEELDRAAQLAELSDTLAAVTQPLAFLLGEPPPLAVAGSGGAAPSDAGLPGGGQRGGSRSQRARAAPPAWVAQLNAYQLDFEAAAQAAKPTPGARAESVHQPRLGDDPGG